MLNLSQIMCHSAADNHLKGLYTALVVCLNIISSGGGSNLYPPEDFITFTPQDIQDRIKGSKIVIISEQVSQYTTSSSEDTANQDHAGNAERHLCNQSLHANHVLPPNPRPPSPKDGLLPRHLRNNRLGRHRNRLLHSLHPLLRLLRHATPKPTMHNPPTLRHCPSLFQHFFRYTHALHPPSPHHKTQHADKTKSRPHAHIQHGRIRYPSSDLDEGFQSK